MEDLATGSSMPIWRSCPAIRNPQPPPAFEPPTLFSHSSPAEGVLLSSLLSGVVLRAISAILPPLGAVFSFENELCVGVTNASAALVFLIVLAESGMCGCDLSEKRGVSIFCEN